MKSPEKQRDPKVP